MTIAVKDASAAAKKFVDRGQISGGEYTAGVQGAGQRWHDATANSEESYAAGVQGAISRKSFSKGVSEAGPAKYVDRATKVGGGRFQEGIRQAGPEWQRKTAPYLDVLRNLDIGPRRERGNPGNMQRAQAVVTALRAKKVAG